MLNPLAGKVRDTVLDAARWYDRSAVSAAGLAGIVMDAFIDYRQWKASYNPAWSAIEQRRRVPGRPDLKTFLSDDLTLADLDEQQRIARELAPDPWWFATAAAIEQHLTVADKLRGAERMFQRAVRGWSDSDARSLGATHTHRLGQQLLFLAEKGDRFPGRGKFTTAEAWQAALLKHGTALVTSGAANPDVQAAEDHLEQIALDPLVDRSVVRAALDAVLAAEKADAAVVRASLRWVAKHHHLL
jgi:hypothetical protein